MLELEVNPEQGLSNDQIELILGMHFSQAVAAIQSLVGIIKNVHILYSELDPLNVDLSINLSVDGIKLVFDPVKQRLKTIEVHDLTKLRLKYSDVLFNCPEVSPTIEQIDQTFGATHPGVYDGEKNVFTLTFRGLSFEFPASSKFQPSFPGIKQQLGRLQFPPGDSPRVSRMYIYTGPSLSECRAALPSTPLPRYPSIDHERVEIIRENSITRGLRVTLVSLPACRDEGEDNSLNRCSVCEIRFGNSVQDVVSAIGSPPRIYYKDEDKMKIHSPNSHRRAADQKSDYFYNYFTLGFDILFDAKTNAVKKFILHTNFPGHYNFNMYYRCQFELPLYPDNVSSSGNRQYISMTPLVVTAFTRWEEISDTVKPSDRPVVLNRASSTNTTNPFGSTFCYGYQDIIFEVMPNGQIGSITLYCTDFKRRNPESSLEA